MTGPKSPKLDGSPGNVRKGAAKTRSGIVFGKKDPVDWRQLVFGNDERVEIAPPRTKSLPWRLICSLEIEGPNGKQFRGTGWLAGPRLIITAGHCVYQDEYLGGFATSIRVVPGRAGGSEKDAEPYGAQNSLRFDCPEEWQQSASPEHDIGCIFLDEPIGDMLGYFAVSALSDDELTHQQLNIAGYPNDVGNSNFIHHSANLAKSVSDEAIVYEIDTWKGQSGSPIWVQETADSAPLIVGIHAGTIVKSDGIANRGARMTPERLALVEGWRKETGKMERTTPAVAPTATMKPQPPEFEPSTANLAGNVTVPQKFGFEAHARWLVPWLLVIWVIFAFSAIFFGVFYDLKQEKIAIGGVPIPDADWQTSALIAMMALWMVFAFLLFVYTRIDKEIVNVIEFKGSKISGPIVSVIAVLAAGGYIFSLWQANVNIEERFTKFGKDRSNLLERMNTVISDVSKIKNDMEAKLEEKWPFPRGKEIRIGIKCLDNISDDLSNVVIKDNVGNKIDNANITQEKRVRLIFKGNQIALKYENNGQTRGFPSRYATITMHEDEKDIAVMNLDIELHPQGVPVICPDGPTRSGSEVAGQYEADKAGEILSKGTGMKIYLPVSESQ